MRRWNWGAFALSLFWAAAMNQWAWFALCFLPYANIIVIFYLAIKGNELAWKSRRWDSLEQFQATQAVWNNWGIAIFIIHTVLIGLIIIATISSQNYL